MSLAWMANNWGRMGLAAAKGSFGRTIQGATIGAAAGAGWGMMSSDTSVLGGMLMGAGLGAVGARYGGAGLRKGWRGGQGFMSGVRAQARRDYRGLFSNTSGASVQKAAQGRAAPRGATMSSNAPRSRIIKRGQGGPLRVPPGIHRLNRQTFPGFGGNSEPLYGGSRRNIIRRRDARFFGV
jgi:hypothetical protein